MTMTPERIHVLWGPGGAGVTYMEERFAPPSSAAEYVRADVADAQAAELTRLRAKVEAADKLAEAMADAVGALDSAGEELSDFANILSRDPWQANHAYESAVQARAALSAYEEAGK